MAGFDIVELDSDYQPDEEQEIRWALAYILTSHDENEIKTKKLDLRNNLFDYIKEHGEEDENGNLFIVFAEPMSADGEEWISGLMIQRRSSEFVDDDKAWEIIKKHDLETECTVMNPEIDYDALYACNQRGLIPDEDIDYILETEETWALVKIKI